jgi:hypothetical protein
MKVLVYTVASICIAMVLFAIVTRAHDTTGAIVSVEVEDDNDTSIEVIGEKFAINNFNFNNCLSLIFRQFGIYGTSICKRKT